MIRASIAHQLAASHEAGHWIARHVLALGAGAIRLHVDGSGSTHRAVTLDLTRLAETATRRDGFTRLEAEVIACHAGRAAEEWWWYEERRAMTPFPQDARGRHAGDREAIRFLRAHFPRATTLTNDEMRCVAVSLVHDHASSLRRLVEILCARPLPVTLSGAEAARVVREARV